jgi:hypothetical protein
MLNLPTVSLMSADSPAPRVLLPRSVSSYTGLKSNMTLLFSFVSKASLSINMMIAPTRCKTMPNFKNFIENCGIVRVRDLVFYQYLKSIVL